jgi:DNA-binding GntR family transcriptional regulator
MSSVNETPRLRAVTVPASLRKQVVENLREAIIERRLSPGERLVERELCELLGVSRTSIREALVELEAEGLIHNIPNRGPVVARISPKLAEEVYQLRAALEGLAAQLFARRATDAQIAELERATEALEAVYRDFTSGPFLAAKNRFYNVMLEGAGNELAAHVLRSMHVRVSQLRITSLSERSRSAKSIKEIWRIVRAIKARDEKAALEASVDHVNNAAKAALAVLQANKNSESVNSSPTKSTR